MAEDTPQAGRRPDRRRRLLILAIALAVVVLLAVVSLEVTSQPYFCAVCHEIKPAVASWQRGTHWKLATCFDCHAEPGVIGYLKTKIRGLTVELRIHLTNPPKVVSKTFVPISRCLACHQKDFNNPSFVDEHPTGPDQYCPECHGKEIHKPPGGGGEGD